jgi:hypothetical protein
MSDTTITELPSTNFIGPEDYIVLDREDKTFKINLNLIGGFNTKNIFYVSPNGSDNLLTHTGTGINLPFKTLKRACSEISKLSKEEEYTILLNPGTYKEENPIIVPENVTILGQDKSDVIIEPLNKEYDVFWVGNKSNVKNLTIVNHLSPAAAISFPTTHLERDFFLNSITEVWGKMGLDIDETTANQELGRNVSLNSAGDVLAAVSLVTLSGPTSIIKIYRYNSDDQPWTQIGNTILGGSSISLNASGNIIVVGFSGADGNGIDSGIVRVYKLIDTNWVQQGQDIVGEAAYDYSGFSVSINAAGDIVAIGAYRNDGNGLDSGHVRVYQFNGTNWVKQGQQDIDGEAPDDASGYSVSLNAAGDTVAIGAQTNDGNGNDSGHVRVYKFNGTNWVKQGQDIDGENAINRSGTSVSLNAVGDIVAIGAPNNSGNGGVSGQTRVYKFNGSNWVQQGQDIDGEFGNIFFQGDQSGSSVSLNDAGDIVAIGAPFNDGVNGQNSGHVRIYKFISGSWVKQILDIDGEAANDYSGTSVSLNATGNIVAIGAPTNDGGANNAGHVRVYRKISSSNDPVTNEYNAAYNTLFYEIEEPNEFSFINNPPTVENVRVKSQSILFPIQKTDLIPSYYFNIPVPASYDFAQTLAGISRDVVLDSISASPILTPKYPAPLPAYEQVINYIANKKSYYVDQDDYYGLRNILLTNYSIDPFLTLSSKQIFFRDVKIIFDSLMYDLSANTNRLAIETGKTWTTNISSLILPYQNNSNTRNAIVSCLNFIFKDFEFNIFDDTPLIIGNTLSNSNIYGAVSSEFAIMSNYVNSITAAYDPINPSIPSEYNTTSNNIITNNSFLLKNIKEYIKLKYYGQLTISEIDWYTSNVSLIIDAIGIDLKNISNSTVIHYSNIYFYNIQNEGMSHEIASDILSYLYRIISPNTSNNNEICGDGVVVDGDKVFGDFRGILCHNSEFELLGGDGLVCKNNGHLKASNIKTLFCNESVLTEDGGWCFIDDSSSSYGLSGLVARETNKTKLPVLSAKTVSSSPIGSRTITIGNTITANKIYDTDSYNGIIASYPYSNMYIEIQYVLNGPYFKHAIEKPVTITPFSSTIINLIDPLTASIDNNVNVRFYNRSLIVANSHLFDYIGTGISYALLPQYSPNVNIPANEICFDSTTTDPRGIIYYTSINQDGIYSLGEQLKVYEPDQVVNIKNDISGTPNSSQIYSFIIDCGEA